MKKQNYQAAKTLGDAAGAKGMEALAALPPTTAVDPKEIDDLKSQNQHNLADSLANVKRLLHIGMAALLSATRRAPFK